MKTGDFVQTTMKAKWYGKIISVNKFNCAVVEITLDKNRKPVKATRTALNCSLLIKLDSEPTAC